MLKSVIDLDTLAVLDDLFGNNLYLSELYPPYQEQADEAKISLAKAISSLDAKALIFHAHGLKSSSAQLGALRVSSACQELENLGHAPDWAQIMTAFNQLQSELKAAVSELSELEYQRRTHAA